MKKKPNHSTEYGEYFLGDSSKLLERFTKEYAGKVQLILTSPPFPLNNKKSYGNLEGEEYKEWFVRFAEVFSRLLTDDGSIVIELGNAWLPGRPVQSLLHLECLMDFVKNPVANLRLCQQFICYNPSRLPSPAAWVTVQRIRLTDSYTNVWWMAKSDFPKADNRKVLRDYSKSMKKLLERQSYNQGKRPSEHVISENGFLVNHGGSITPNVLELEPMDETREVRLPNVLSLSNSSSNDPFMRRCREKGIAPHPARMPAGLAAFFIQFLTDPGDLVLDPFAGSNTTGFAAEKLKRRWISIETLKKYSEQSKIRLNDPALHSNLMGE
ncbi:MAG: site-specific DNA-methyltransferase [Anaerolineae bacterium]|nr:site-specific DNA-methyltransferase [Anaerolineae bacterium]